MGFSFFSSVCLVEGAFLERGGGLVGYMPILSALKYTPLPHKQLQQ